MNRRRPLAALLLAATASACALTSCTREGRRAALGGCELKLMIWGAPDEVQTVQTYVKLFKQKFPAIDVTIQHAPDMGFREKLNNRFIGGDPPDVFYLSYEDFPGVASRGWALPLDELVARDEAAGKFDSKAYFPEVYEQFRFDGKLYGVAKDFATLVLYYNKDLFDKYDVPYPKRGWTWADFLEKAKRLTHPAASEYGFVLETWAGEWYPWILQGGGALIQDDPTSGPRWVLGAEPFLAKNARAFQFLADLMWKEKVAPGPSVTKDQGTSDLFKTGKAAMCTYGRWMCMQFKHIREFDWNVVELPRDEREAATLFPVCYAVARETKNREASWELVKFLTGVEAQKAVGASGQAIPSMKSVAEGPDFTDAKALAGRGIDGRPNVTSVAFSQPAPRLLCWHEVRERLTLGLEALWNGRRPALDILVELQPALEKVVAGEKEAQARARAARGE